MPTWVNPKVSPCASCTSARIAIGGSCAVSVQRTTALSAPIVTSMAGESVKRGESANTTISASTPSAHSPAMVNPPRPDACQVMDPNA